MNKVGFAPTKGVCLFKRLDLNQSPAGFYTYRVCLFRHLFICGGRGWTRTNEAVRQGIYSPPQLPLCDSPICTAQVWTRDQREGLRNANITLLAPFQVKPTLVVSHFGRYHWWTRLLPQVPLRRSTSAINTTFIAAAISYCVCRWCPRGGSNS